MRNQWSKWGRFFLIPAIFSGVLILIHVIGWVFDLDLGRFGLYPGKWEGLIGVFTMPLIHGSWGHLFNNVSSILFLLVGLRFFYQSLFLRIFLISYLLPGLLAWFFARPSYHIGASGMIYALAGFLFFSGVIRLNRYLLAFSLAIAFWYGGLFWGMFPMEPGISWEGHLAGGLVGFLSALFFRRTQPADIFDDPDPFEDEHPDHVDPLIGDAWKGEENEGPTSEQGQWPPKGYRVVYRIRPKTIDNENKEGPDTGSDRPGGERSPGAPSGG